MRARRSPNGDASILKALTYKPKPGAKPGATTRELCEILGTHPSIVQQKLHKLHTAGRLVVTRAQWPGIDGVARLHTFYRIKGR